MSRGKLGRLTEDELIGLFRRYAIEQEIASLDSDTTTYNRLFNKMTAINDELKARGPEARKHLLPLMDDANIRVRYAAAMNCLAVDRERAVAVLRAIEASQWMPEAGQAGMALLHLEEGVFRPT